MRARSSFVRRVAAISMQRSDEEDAHRVPSHQSSHAEPYGVAAADPATASVVTPFVALIAVATNAASNVSQRTSTARSSDGRKSTRRRR